MPKTCSNEIKEQVIKECIEVGNITLVSNKHGLNAKTVNRWVNDYHRRDEITELKKIRELEKIIKDRNLEIEVLKSLLKKTFPHWNNAEVL